MSMIKVAGALLVLVLDYICSNDQVEELSYGFYDKVCPQLEGIIRGGVESMSFTDPTTPAALLRLMFHDCQVQGCDASILVDTVDWESNYKSEMTSSRNLGIRKREAMNLLKSLVEAQWAHTLGVTHCFNIESRLYDDPSKRDQANNEHGREFEMYLKLSCPQGSITSNVSFELNEPTTLTFDNHYFINAINGRGVLRIDAEIPFGPRTAPFVQRFAADQDAFFQAFSSAFVKLSTSGILTDSQGTVRRSCNALN
ncbi:hypothetical protein RND71_001983 [Anisodus tanguticus]|uniref:peroxidase n=1 Tax=Anisodus tanguticus TaxID=243964 RepID=A0AAE1T3B7_9SOLA|nr:hypothetical protein RND71_001983 [Anisodus tanguticus]